MSLTLPGSFGAFAFGVTPFGYQLADPPYAMLATVTPSYLYVEYNDDENLQAFVTAYNGLAQQYVNWFNQVGLPIWTGSLIAGPLLDWVGNGLYGISRPVFTTSTSTSFGPIATFPIAMNPIAARTVRESGSATIATDDIYKRVMTWNLYTGDGRQFTTRWLKRRIERFLHGAAGVDPIVDETYDVSVTQAAGAFTIRIPVGGVSQYLLQAFANGVLNVPFQYTYEVLIGQILTDTSAATLTDAAGLTLYDTGS